MADPKFNSKLAVNAKGGFDEGKLKGKSVVVTGGSFHGKSLCVLARPR